MDVWKIQLVIVAFCALMQTYWAESPSTVSKIRSLSSAWQVSFINVDFYFYVKFCLIW